MSQVAFAFLQQGQPRRAEAACRAALVADPRDAGAAMLLAFSLQAQGRSAEAVPLLAQLARSEPGVGEHWNNLGNALRETQRHDEAADAFRTALTVCGETPSLLLNAGLNALDAGDAGEAQRWLERAAALAPEDPQILAFCGVAAMQNNDDVRVRELVGDWRGWHDADDATLGETAWLLFRIGAIDDAEHLFARLARNDPHDLRTRVRQAAMHERSNRLDEARAIVDALARRDDLPPAVAEDLALLHAALASREADAPAARRLHETLLATNPPRNGVHHLHFSLARLCDKLGDAPAAMRALADAHREQTAPVRRNSPQLFDGTRPPLTIARYRTTPAQYAQWPRDEPGTPDADASPVFVVGFPRSGTTMLETMLDAHPRLACMDERPYLQHLVERIQAWGLAYPDDLGRLDAAQCAELRALYAGRVARHVALGDGQRLVDKNPLNMLKLPLLRRLWPHAKIVLALRHPADVVVSNYFQCYQSQVFVAMCETPEAAARGYAAAFDFWIDQRDVLAPDVFELRYEDLVGNPESQARRLLAFLGLPWDDAVLRFHEHARRRGYISTPSYAQVIEPINARAVGRARAYAPWLEGAGSILAPYVARFGYRPLGA